MQKFSTYLSQCIEAGREDSLLPSIFAEPLELQNTVEIKSEIPEIENFHSNRKCKSFVKLYKYHEMHLVNQII